MNNTGGKRKPEQKNDKQGNLNSNPKSPKAKDHTTRQFYQSSTTRSNITY